MRLGSEITDVKFKSKDNYTTTLKPVNSYSTKGKFSPRQKGIGIIKGTHTNDVSFVSMKVFKDVSDIRW